MAKRHVTSSIAWALLSFGACVSSSQSHEPTLQELRDATQGNPKRVEAWAELATYELLGDGGDAQRGRLALDRVLVMEPSHVRARFLSAVSYHVHGELEKAFAEHQRVLALAARAKDPWAATVFELSLVSLRGLEDWVPDGRIRLKHSLDNIPSEQLTPTAKIAHGRWKIDEALRQGNAQKARELAQDLGCPTQWSTVGPFGPGTLLGFEQRLPPDNHAQLRASYADPNRGALHIRNETSLGCEHYVENTHMPRGGTSFVESVWQAPRSGNYTLLLETSQWAKVYVDGALALLRSTQKSWSAPYQVRSVVLSKGEHRIRVKLSARVPYPHFSLALIPETSSQALPAPTHLFERYVQALLQTLRGDVVAAQTVVHLANQTAAPAALFLWLEGQLALFDPLSARNTSSNLARTLFKRAQKRDPKNWVVLYELARLDLKQTPLDTTVAFVERAQKDWPKVAAWDFLLAQVYLDRGLEPYAAQRTQTLLKRLPEHCEARLLAHQIELAQDGFCHDATHLQKLLACDARSEESLQSARIQRNWPLVVSEVKRLAPLLPSPKRARFWTAELEALRGTAPPQEQVEFLKAHVQHTPTDATARNTLIDSWMAQDNPSEAKKTLAEAFVTQSQTHMGSWPMTQALGMDPLEGLYPNGVAELEAFRKSGRSYAEPVVWVLDYTALRVFEDGSSLEYTHNIIKLQSQESIDEYGEFEVPADSHVATLHTIKQDGTLLEPDLIVGKDSYSLRNVEVGDFIEYAFVRTVAPPDLFPGGFVGQRFYFQTMETSFDRSELVVVAPRTLPLTFETRGDAPKMSTAEQAGLRTYRWRADQQTAAVPEPHSVSASEYLPSVQVGARVDAKRAIRSWLDVLIDRDAADPQALVLLEHIAPAKQLNTRARAERIYHWVLNHIEESEDFFGLAPAMLKARQGSRERILKYLYTLAGIPAELLVTRNIWSPRSDLAFFDAEAFRNLLVRIHIDNKPIWLYTTERGSPFGYLPPLLRGQKGYMLGADAPQVTVPTTSAIADHHAAHVEVVLQKTGAAELTIKEVFRGAQAVSWREQLESIPEAELHARFEAAYAAQLIPKAKLLSLRITGQQSTDNELCFLYTVFVQDFASANQNQLTVDAILPLRLSSRFATLPTRKTPLLIPAPLHGHVVIELTLPPGATLKRIPPNTRHSWGARHRYEQRVTQPKGRVVLHKTFSIPSQRIEASAYKAFVDFCHNVDQADDTQLVIRLNRGN